MIVVERGPLRRLVVKIDGAHFTVPLPDPGLVTVELQPNPLPDSTLRAQVFSDTAFTATWVALMIAYAVRRLPYALRSCMAALTQLHVSLEEALAALMRDDKPMVGVRSGAQFVGVLTPNGIHRALREVFGTTGPEGHRFDGKTGYASVILPRGGDFEVVTAVADGWLVMGFVPQSVEAFYLRMDGKLDRWKPSAKHEKAFAELPKEFTSITVTDTLPTGLTFNAASGTSCTPACCCSTSTGSRW